MSDETPPLNQVDSTTALQVRKQPQPGDVLDGIYRLDQPLGKGGVGVVFRAWHLHLQRPCAIKFLHPQLVSNPELRTRFRREAQSAFQLGHPHIVAITDFRDDPNAWPYIVMELVQGETLRDRLERGPLGAATAVRLMVELCDALHAAHRRGVIHRDLKPENLILAKAEGQPAEEPSLKVLDFGMSKLLDGAEITGSGRLLGSPSYMSPEQARGDSHLVDARSDIFSVGGLLYECLTSDKLWSAEKFEEKRQQIIAAKLPPLQLTARGLPPQIEQIIAKACARLPEERYQTASALMEALSQLRPQLSNQPLAPLPAPVQTDAPRKPTVDSSSTAISMGGGELISSRSSSPPKKSSMMPVALMLGLAALAGVGYAGYTVMQSYGGSQVATTGTGATGTAGTGTTPSTPVTTQPASTGTEPVVPPTPAAAEDLRPAEVVQAATPGPVPTPTPTEPDDLPKVAGGTDVKPAVAVQNTGAPATPTPAVAVTGPKPGVKLPAPKKWGGPARPIPTAPSGQLPTAPAPGPDEPGVATTEKAVPTVNGVMRRAMPALVRCYGGDAPLPGKISVDLTIQSDGRVAEANIDGAEDQGSCVTGVMRNLRFAPPTDSDTYGIHYDFVNLRR